jgi:DNA-binding beta-propeller fold protein YncE
MSRYIFMILAGMLLVPQARPATSSAYYPVQFSALTSFNTSTWQPGAIIPAANADTFVLSADGATIYAVEHSSAFGCAPGCTLGHVLVIERSTGKTLHSYQTHYPIWGGLAVLPNQTQIYVYTCSSSLDGFTCQGGTVEVLDVVSGKNLAIIPMAGDEISQIVAGPDSATVYVTHYDFTPCFACDVVAAEAQAGLGASGALTQIDVATLQVKGNYSLENYGGGAFALSPDGHKGYLLATYIFFQEGGNGGAVYQIDVESMTSAATLSTNSFCGFGSMGVSPDGNTLAVASDCGYPYSNGLMLFDTATGSLTQTIDNLSGTVMRVTSAGNVYLLGGGGDIDIVNGTTGDVTEERTGLSAGAPAFLPDGQQIMFLFSSASTVLAVDGAANRKLINIMSPPMWLALSPDGQTLYSAAYIGGLLAVSTATGQVVWQTLQSTDWLGAVAASPDGQTLYVVEFDPNNLLIVNASTGAVTSTLALPGCTNGNPGEAIAITPSGGQVYVMVCGVTSVFNAATQTIEGQISGASGAAVAVSPKGNVVYISTGGTAIDIVDPLTNKVTGTIPISASAIAFSPDGGTAYVMSTQNGQSGVAVVDTSTIAVTGFVSGISPFGAWSEHGDTGTGAGAGLGVTFDGHLIFAAGTPGAIIDAQTLTIDQQVQFAGPVVVY